MRVGFVGWRGMVGSVLLQRMRSEGDFDAISPRFFSTSQLGQPGPQVPGSEQEPLEDATNLDRLVEMDVLITCQGGDYTASVYPTLRQRGWTGYWIDAASTLRMNDDAVIVLDPVNREVIEHGIERGIRTFVGGNCTVSLMLMGIAGLLKKGWVEWISAMTYQSASGAGARHVKELIAQMAYMGDAGRELAASGESDVLSLDAAVNASLHQAQFPTGQFGAPLAASLLPWIDRAVDDGQTREEWKAQVEANKILQTAETLRVDGLCVRVPVLRCHSQALTIKLHRDIPLADIEAEIRQAHPWVSVVPNTKEATLEGLTPAAVTSSLKVPVGRLRKLRLGPEFVGCFTVGDQLLWGAAEPLRRVLCLLRGAL